MKNSGMLNSGMTNARAAVEESGFLEAQVDLMRAMFWLVRTVTAAGVRTERIGASGAVGRLITHVKWQTVDSSRTTLKCL